MTTRVLVVGGGLAGLLAAHARRAPVVLLRPAPSARDRAATLRTPGTSH